ncbi:MAG: hypothetical protein WBX30_33430, partial [Stellaceae bacterium]
MGEIPDLLAIAENLDGLATSQPVSKNRDNAGIRRVGVLSWTIKVEKAQSNRRYPMNRAGDPRVKLASTLVGTIGAQWCRRMLLASRNDVAIAVDSRGRGIHYRDFPTISQPSRLFENVDRAREIDLVRTPPLAAGAHNRCYRGEMKAGIYPIESLFDSSRIGDITVYEFDFLPEILAGS